MSLRYFRKDITIDVFNLAGQKVLAYNVLPTAGSRNIRPCPSSMPRERGDDSDH